MKKLGTIGICLSLLVTSLFVTSCNLTDGQAKVVAQNTGLGVSLLWIGQDAPDAEVKALVSTAMDVIQTNLVAISDNTTYTETLLPVITTFARSDAVPDNYEPLVIGGSMLILNGVDVLLVANPDWKLKEGLVVDVAKSFILGAQMGLALDDNDPRVLKAKSFTVSKTKALSIK